jgi:hypothetical protein
VLLVCLHLTSPQALCLSLADLLLEHPLVLLLLRPLPLQLVLLLRREQVVR